MANRSLDKQAGGKSVHWLGSRTGSADSSERLQRASLRVFELEHTGKVFVQNRYELQLLNLKISLKMYSE